MASWTHRIEQLERRVDRRVQPPTAADLIRLWQSLDDAELAQWMAARGLDEPPVQPDCSSRRAGE